MRGVNVVCRSAWSLTGSNRRREGNRYQGREEDSQDVEKGQDALRIAHTPPAERLCCGSNGSGQSALLDTGEKTVPKGCDSGGRSQQEYAGCVMTRIFRMGSAQKGARWTSRNGLRDECREHGGAETPSCCYLPSDLS